MIIYNVTVKVDSDIAASWLLWMKSEHIPDLMKTGLFSGHRICHLLEQDETEGITYVVQYFCETPEHYKSYISEYAQEMRDKGLKRFGNKFIAMRSVMETEA